MISAQTQVWLSDWLARQAGADTVRLENIATLGGGAVS